MTVKTLVVTGPYDPTYIDIYEKKKYEPDEPGGLPCHYYTGLTLEGRVALKVYATHKPGKIEFGSYINDQGRPVRTLIYTYQIESKS